MVKLIGLMDEDQRAMLDLIEETRKQIESGAIKTIGIVACMEAGPAWVMAGKQASHLFLGISMMSDEIKEKVRGVGAQKIERAITASILRGPPKRVS